MRHTSGLSHPIISPYDTWWHKQYVGSLGSTGMSRTSDGCTGNRDSWKSGLQTYREKSNYTGELAKDLMMQTGKHMSCTTDNKLILKPVFHFFLSWRVIIWAFSSSAFGSSFFLKPSATSFYKKKKKNFRKHVSVDINLLIHATKLIYGHIHFRWSVPRPTMFACLTQFRCC